MIERTELYGGPEIEVLSDSERSQKYLKNDPDDLHYYHWCATQLVPGGFQAFFDGDPTTERPKFSLLIS